MCLCACVKPADLQEGTQGEAADLQERTQGEAADLQERTQGEAADLQEGTQGEAADLQERTQGEAADLQEGTGESKARWPRIASGSPLASHRGVQRETPGETGHTPIVSQ